MRTVFFFKDLLTLCCCVELKALLQRHVNLYHGLQSTDWNACINIVHINVRWIGNWVHTEWERHDEPPRISSTKTIVAQGTTRQGCLLPQCSQSSLTALTVLSHCSLTLFNLTLFSHTDLSHCSLTLISHTDLSHWSLTLFSLTVLSHCSLTKVLKNVRAEEDPVKKK